MSIDLAATNVSNGLRPIDAPDGVTTPVDEPGMSFRLDYDAVDRRLILDCVATPTKVISTQGAGAWLSETLGLRYVAFANRMKGSPDTRPVGVAALRIATASQLKVAAVRAQRR